MSGLNFLLWVIAIVIIAFVIFFAGLIVYALVVREKAMKDYRKRKDPKCRECKRWKTLDCPSSKNCFATDTKPYFEKL